MGVLCVCVCAFTISPLCTNPAELGSHSASPVQAQAAKNSEGQAKCQFPFFIPLDKLQHFNTSSQTWSKQIILMSELTAIIIMVAEDCSLATKLQLVDRGGGRSLPMLHLAVSHFNVSVKVG